MLDGNSDFRRIVRRFARSRLVSEEAMPHFDQENWFALAGMGVLGLGTTTGGGSALDVAASIEELGAVGFVGPLVETFMACQMLTEQDVESVSRGETIASVTWDATAAPWGRLADILILIDSDGEAHRCVAERISDVETLGGDCWAHVELRPVAGLNAGHRAFAIGEIAVSAYVIGAGIRVVELAAEYARTRRQFGRPIGDYQAVSHPLAESYARLHSARDLLGVAATEIDTNDSSSAGQLSARLRLISIQSAVDAAQLAIQVHGGMGFVNETLLAHLSKRIRHVSLLGPPQWFSEKKARPTRA